MLLVILLNYLLHIIYGKNKKKIRSFTCNIYYYLFYFVIIKGNKIKTLALWSQNFFNVVQKKKIKNI